MLLDYNLKSGPLNDTDNITHLPHGEIHLLLKAKYTLCKKMMVINQTFNVF